MEIIRRSQAIHIDKSEGTSVDYYLFPEYEIHYNEVPPGTVQVWHHHQVIEETLLMIQGTLEARWKEDGQEKTATLQPGDLVRVEDTPHTFANVSENLVTFVIFRLILQGVDQQARIKNDKHLDE